MDDLTASDDTVHPHRTLHTPRLHTKQSLPNLWLPPHYGPIPAHLARAHQSPPTSLGLAAATRPYSLVPSISSHPPSLPQPITAQPLFPPFATPARPRLKTLDLADDHNNEGAGEGPTQTQNQANAPPTTPPAPAVKFRHVHANTSGVRTPFLTPPLTPSSSIDQDTRDREHGGQGWRRNFGDRTPVSGSERSSYQSEDLHGAERDGDEQGSRAGVSESEEPSRFLLISNVPKHLPSEALQMLFAAYSTDIKGMYVRLQESMGVVVLAFWDERQAARVKRDVEDGGIVMDKDIEEGEGDRIKARFVTGEELGELIGHSSFVDEVETQGEFYVVLEDGGGWEGREAEVKTLRALFEGYGKVKGWEVRGEGIRVEYFNIKDAASAFDLDGKRMFGARLRFFRQEDLGKDDVEREEIKDGGSNTAAFKEQSRALSLPKRSAERSPSVERRGVRFDGGAPVDDAIVSFRNGNGLGVEDEWHLRNGRLGNGMEEERHGTGGGGRARSASADERKGSGVALSSIMGNLSLRDAMLGEQDAFGRRASNNLLFDAVLKAGGMARGEDGHKADGEESIGEGVSHNGVEEQAQEANDYNYYGHGGSEGAVFASNAGYATSADFSGTYPSVGDTSVARENEYVQQGVGLDMGLPGLESWQRYPHAGVQTYQVPGGGGVYYYHHPGVQGLGQGHVRKQVGTPHAIAAFHPGQREMHQQQHMSEYAEYVNPYAHAAAGYHPGLQPYAMGLGGMQVHDGLLASGGHQPPHHSQLVDMHGHGFAAQIQGQMPPPPYLRGYSYEDLQPLSLSPHDQLSASPSGVYGSPHEQLSPSHIYSHATNAHTLSPHSPLTHSPTSPQAVRPEHNQVNLARIEDGADTRTTVMIKNIPNKMSDKDLIEYIGRVCPRRVDFLYLRMDFQNGCNVGYAFVNFITVQDLLHFAKARLGVKWNMYSSEKVLQMSYGTYQGKEALVEKFKNSCIMDEREEWRPKIFFSDGPNQGLPEPFPKPTHLRRKERSSHNRGALFVPGLHHNHQYDRERLHAGDGEGFGGSRPRFYLPPFKRGRGPPPHLA